MEEPIDRPRNSAQWTEGQFRRFVISALRRAKWPVKYEALNAACRGTEINPKTRRKRKIYACAACNGRFGAKDVQVDHIVPVQAGGSKDWESLVERMFCELEGFQVLCSQCHDTKSICEMLNVHPDEVPTIKRVAAFRKMTAKEQVALLGSLGLECGNNASRRLAAFTEWVNHNDPVEATPPEPR